MSLSYTIIIVMIIIAEGRLTGTLEWKVILFVACTSPFVEI